MILSLKVINLYVCRPVDLHVLLSILNIHDTMVFMHLVFYLRDTVHTDMSSMLWLLTHLAADVKFRPGDRSLTASDNKVKITSNKWRHYLLLELNWSNTAVHEKLLNFSKHDNTGIFINPPPPRLETIGKKRCFFYLWPTSVYNIYKHIIILRTHIISTVYI